MPRALEGILAFKTSLTGGAFEDLAPGTDASFTVRSIADGSKAWLEEVWAADSAHKAQLSIKSPLMHDDVRGILAAFTSLDGGGSLSFNPQNLLPGYSRQELYRTDVLSVQALGTASDAVAAILLARYEDLPGADARLTDWMRVDNDYSNIVGIDVAPVASATKGQWGAGVALNSSTTRLKADRDYALLGWSSDIPVTAIGIKGSDTGNLRIAGPGSWDVAKSGSFFVDLAEKYGFPHIPVINSNNQGSTLVQIADVVASTAPTVTLFFALLNTKYVQA